MIIIWSPMGIAGLLQLSLVFRVDPAYLKGLSEDTCDCVAFESRNAAGLRVCCVLAGWWDTRHMSVSLQLLECSIVGKLGAGDGLYIVHLWYFHYMYNCVFLFHSWYLLFYFCLTLCPLQILKHSFEGNTREV